MGGVADGEESLDYHCYHVIFELPTVGQNSELLNEKLGLPLTIFR